MIVLFLLSAFAAEVDRLAVAARLLADGLPDRAADVLREVEPRPKELGRYHTLRGLVAFENGQHAVAAEQLALATEHEVPPIAWVTLAAARVELERWEPALVALESVNEPLPAVPLLQGRALSGLGRHGEALQALLDGRAAHPTDVQLVSETVRQLTALGLYAEVLHTAPSDLAAVDAPMLAWERVLQGLIEGRAWYETVAFGEELLLVHPDSLRARLGLASACLELEQNDCAGHWLAEAAALDPTYAVQASEVFRRTGELDRALYLNSLVVDPAAKARQRLGLLVEQEAYAEATALDPRLVRLGLLEEDAVTYALAYAHVQVGNRERAEQLVTRLVQPAFARQGTVLLESLP